MIRIGTESDLLRLECRERALKTIKVLDAGADTVSITKRKLKMSKYFAAFNTYASASSKGFSNTWEVLVFNCKKCRDEWVDINEYNRNACEITKKEVSNYATCVDSQGKEIRPVPFSGEFWGIDDRDVHADKINGCIGSVIVCDSDSSCDRLHA